MKKEKAVQTATETNSNECDIGDSKRTFKSILTEKKNSYAYLGLAGLIPAVVVLIIYMIATGGLYPFGNGTPLILDLNSQYIYFFSALRNAIFGKGELLYSFSRSLGGEFLGIYAYYLASPLSYLVCLFPADRMQEFAMFLLTLKTALCGITMGYYLHRHSEKHSKPTVIAFAIMYALCSYAIVYQSNTMWIDALIWLPLLTLGIEELVKHGKYKLFVISLTLTIASNYYIGYMCCIFVLLYFLYYTYSFSYNSVNNPQREKNHFVKSTVRIAIFSALAILMAAVMICAAYYSLSFGKNDFSDPNYDINIRVNFFDVLFKLYPGTYDTVRPTNFSSDSVATAGFPFIYCGLITLLLVPVFFMSKKFSLREKIGSAVIVGFFILSFVISIIDIAWHGFQEPQWLNNRYSFMLSFLMIIIAFRAFENIEEKGIGSAIIFSAVFFGAFAIVIQKLAPEINESIKEVNSDFELGNFQFALFAVIMLAVYVVIMAVMRHSGDKELIATILLIVITVEMLLNGISNTVDFADDVVFTTYSKFDEFQDIMYPITETVQENDTSFYRMEKTAYRKPNDNMQFNIRGVANSTSTLNASSIQLLQMMGYSARAQWSIYLGGNPVNDSLLGIKYIISDRDFSEFYGEPVYTAEDFAKHEGISVDELIEQTMADNSGSENYSNKSAADFYVYKNPYALSIAFAASDDVIDFNMKAYNTYVSKDDDKYNSEGYTNPFERLNALVSAILGDDEPVELFKPATQESVTYTDDVKYTVSNGEIKHHKYVGKNGKVTFKYSVPTDKTLYMYLPAYYTRQVDISASTPIADGTKNFGSNVSTNPTLRIVELGSSDTSDYELTVKITNSSGQFYVQEQESYIYYIDTDVLAQVYSTLQKGQLNITEYSESSFKGNISTKSNDQLILTTIPYDSGWQVKVDGKSVETLDAVDTTPGVDGGGALLAFRIDSTGEHTVELVYRPKIIIIGAVISGTAILIFIATIVLEKKLLRIKPIKKVFYIEETQPEDETINTERVGTNSKKQKKRKD